MGVQGTQKAPARVAGAQVRETSGRGYCRARAFCQA